MKKFLSNSHRTLVWSNRCTQAMDMRGMLHDELRKAQDSAIESEPK